MTHRRLHSRDQGVVLIVVVGVLAVLSLLAATFGMIMSVEVAASRNQTEHQMAMLAAHAGAEFLISSLGDYASSGTGITGSLPTFCPGTITGVATAVTTLSPYTLTDSSKTLATDCLKGGRLRIVGNPGAGYDYVISGNTATTLTVTAAWTVNPAAGSRYEVILDDFGCQQLYRRDGLRAYWEIHEHTPVPATAPATGAVIASWAQGLGNEDSGMFNLNGMGHIADVGVVDKSIHCTSFDTSLVALLVSCFEQEFRGPLGGKDTSLDSYYANFSALSAAGQTARWNVACLINSAIMARRYGDDGVPGIRGNEKARPSHVPDYVAYTPYRNAQIASPGLGVSGAFWGKAAAGTTAIHLVADTTQPGWWWPATGWSANKWSNYYLYMATGVAAGQWRQITASAGNTLDWALPLQNANGANAAPNAGDAFCILFGDSSLPWANLGKSDGAPGALRLPDGTLTCETVIGGTPFSNILVMPRLAMDLASANTKRPFPWATGLIADVPDSTHALIETPIPVGTNLAGYVFRVVDGAGRGQVRPITGYSGATLTLGTAWSTSPAPTVLDSGSGTAAGTLFTDGSSPAKTWTPRQWVGKVLRLAGGAMAYITDNDTLTLTLSGSLSGTGTYDIVQCGGYAIETDWNYDYDAPTTPNGKYFSGFVTSTGAGTLVDNTRGGASTPAWRTNDLTGMAVNIVAGAGAGQTRVVLANDAQSLTVDRPWRTALNNTSQYRVEVPQDYKFRPDDLAAGDTTYLSLGDLRDSIIIPAFEDAKGTAAARAIADILIPRFQTYLSVSTRSMKANQQLAGINDWGTDGIDNDGNGVIDDKAEADMELPANRGKLAGRLYKQLGLDAWVKIDPTNRLAQAAQLVANLIDFRDNDDVPTRVTNADLGESASVTVYGCEGVHLTEVMASVGRFPPTGSLWDECIDDGDPAGSAGAEPADGNGWDHLTAPDRWQLTADNKWGKWQFAAKEGWYAVRLFGNNGPIEFQPSGAATSYIVNFDSGAALDHGYVRDANGLLVAVNVPAAGTFEFQLRGLTGVEFTGIELLPQYVEITNGASHDVPLSHLRLGTTSVLLPAGARINGAASNGPFPIQYGTYVVALGQGPYARQWGDGADDLWGSSLSGIDEGYPVHFTGDAVDSSAAAIAAANTRADAFIAGLPSGVSTPAGPLPRMEVWSNGSCIAWTDAGAASPDGNAGTCTAYTAQEKTGSPFSSAAWAPFGTAPKLEGSQNQAVQLQADPPRATARTIRSGLNRNYTAIWDAAGYPTLKKPSELAAGNQVFPVILNRPYPTTGWLGLVPTGHDPWRTVDPNPTPSLLVGGVVQANKPAVSEHLLGTLMEKATVGNVYARMNINSAPEAVLNSVFRSGFVDSGTAVSGGVNTLGDTLKGWSTPILPAGRNAVVFIDEGAGKGQVRLVTSNTLNTLTVWPNWDTIPDNTSKYRIMESDAGRVIVARGQRVLGQKPYAGANPFADASIPEALAGKSWANWDEILIDPTLQLRMNSSDTTCGLGFYYNGANSAYSAEDTGAGTAQDGFIDDSDEREEWARRYSNLFDLRSTTFRFIVAGLVYQDRKDAPPAPLSETDDRPVAAVRIEMDVDLSTGKPQIVHFRYLGQ